MQINELLTSNYSEASKCDIIYQFCSKESNTIELFNLLQNPSHNENLSLSILNSALLGALENSVDSNFLIIADYINKNNIIKNNEQVDLDPYASRGFKKRTMEQLQAMFNCATYFEELEFAVNLEKKYSILTKSISENIDKSVVLSHLPHFSSATLNSDGTLSIMSIKSGPIAKHKRETEKYAINPILFNLKNSEFELLDLFLKNNYDISPLLIKQAVVLNIFLENREAISYLFSNKKCADIIKKSEDIQLFINSDNDFPEKKAEAKMLLSMLTENNLNIHKLKM